ncbi:MAG: energy transducer TonB [Muribaculaceae bacterium]|nr:energy transducer TonB [Muribaculaceae bacterium]
MTQQYMLTSSGKILITMLLAMLATGAQAQFRQVITYQTVVGGNRVVSREAFTFDSVDEEPHFPGGDGAMMKFINRERRYPADAFEAGIQGRVLCSFVVQTDGTISNAEVLRGVDKSLNREALRIIERMPRWVAGKIGDTKVPVYCILPITFRL